MTRALLVLLGVTGVASAGMPTVTAVLNETPKLRLQTISFFLAGFFLSSWFIQLLWNYLRRDFTSLPRLSYFRAVGLVGLWGLLFVLVLTMISGARELMTPGAWEPDGVTHRLAHKGGPAPADEALAAVRRDRVERLKGSLWEHARTHDGRFPPSLAETVPGPSGMRYVYAGGQATLFDPVPLAYEPEVFEGARWVLFTDGTIRQLSSEEMRGLSGGPR